MVLETIDGNDRFENEGNETKNNGGFFGQEFGRWKIHSVRSVARLYCHGFHGKLQQMKRARDER